jgi:hypothetical protein
MSASCLWREAGRSAASTAVEPAIGAQPALALQVPLKDVGGQRTEAASLLAQGCDLQLEKVVAVGIRIVGIPFRFQTRRFFGKQLLAIV